MWVLPVPDGPSTMQFWRFSIHSQCASSRTSALLSDGWALKSNGLRLLDCGNRAIRMRRWPDMGLLRGRSRTSHHSNRLRSDFPKQRAVELFVDTLDYAPSADLAEPKDRFGSTRAVRAGRPSKLGGSTGRARGAPSARATCAKSSRPVGRTSAIVDSRHQCRSRQSDPASWRPDGRAA
jgi:hypothetical protein